VNDRSRQSQSGFTLSEAAVATLILTIGLMAVSNLSVLATGSNAVASRSTAAALVATQRLEQLKMTSFSSLTDSPTDSIDVDQPGFNEDVNIPSLGQFHTRWRIATVGAYGTTLKYIHVRTEARGFMGRRTRAEFTTMRSCTTPSGAAGASCPPLT
jgi:Tfp pilus assembly protein PilV